ncbi:MAG: AAA family ATPase, partial [Methylomonas sp.]|nr:AAA family ATPase [Methylomonas sp.]
MKKLHFGIYSLDPAAACLLKHGETVPLPPKALAFLGFLLEQRGRLVAKDELLDKVWGHRFVSQGVLKNTVTLLRQALGDDPKAPRYIETVHRLGYRFIADITTGFSSRPQPLANADSVCYAGDSSLVGRDETLAELWRILDNAAESQSRLVFVSGEAGIGKTALIETFARAAASRASCGRGQYFEQYGTGEPYMPVLEALNDLMRQESERLLELMRQVAPSWLAQLPWYRESAWPDSRQAPTAVSPLRMARELGEFLTRSSREKPLILVLEDLHWSDRATLDLLAYLARRRQAERWMIVASYRPEDALLAGHELKAVRRELTIQGLCRNVALQPLSEIAVKEYLARRFPGRQIPDAWIKTLRDRTDGLPYFLVRLVEGLQSEQILAGDADQGGLSAPLPEGMALLLARQFERLPDGYRRVLEAACVSGTSFSAEAVAAALQEDAAEIEACLENLARMRQFIEAGEDSSARAYRFHHAFQREFVHGRLLPAQR